MSSTTFELTRLKNSLNNNFNSIMKNIESLEYNANKSGAYVNINQAQIYAMKKKFVDYLINGIDYHESIEFLKIDYPISQNVIDNILRVKFDMMNRGKISHKIFAAKVLYKKGFKTKIIADILDCTPATVRNYLKV